MLTAVKANGISPPARVGELERVEPFVPQSATELRSGDLVYFWGASLSTEGNAANTLLAHEKKVPTAGGWVLMQDGTVKEMTPQQFSASPKAKSK